MAGERVKLQVKEREHRGSADARRLRREGFIPGVLYGKGNQPHAICVPERELRRVLTGQGGLHAILDVVLEGQETTHASILKEYQQDPIRGRQGQPWPGCSLERSFRSVRGALCSSFGPV